MCLTIFQNVMLIWRPRSRSISRVVVIQSLKKDWWWHALCFDFAQHNALHNYNRVITCFTIRSFQGPNVPAIISLRASPTSHR